MSQLRPACAPVMVRHLFGLNSAPIVLGTPRPIGVNRDCPEPVGHLDNQMAEFEIH